MKAILIDFNFDLSSVSAEGFEGEVNSRVVSPWLDFQDMLIRCT